MTPLDLLADFRDTTNDLADTGPPDDPNTYTYRWEEDDSGLLWRNAELVRHLNWAIEEMAIRTRGIEDRATVDICQIAIVAGTAEYNYDPRILTIEEVRLDGKPLTKTLFSSLDHDYSKWQEEEGTPEQYVEHEGVARLRLYPTPVANDTLKLAVTRRPLTAVALNALNTNIPWPADSQFNREALVAGMMARAYRKRDSQTFSPQEGAMAEADFNRMVGPPVDALTLERRRINANLRAQYTPTSYVRKPRVRGGFWQTDQW